jgi:hypothetical protein
VGDGENVLESAEFVVVQEEGAEFVEGCEIEAGGEGCKFVV